MTTWDSVAALVDRVPAGVWMALAVVNVALGWSVARRRIRRLGQRAGNGTTTKDAALTAAAMIPAVLFWAMVLAGSFHGLVAFGREELNWGDGWEYLVPGTLDGVSVTFAFLAFRAVRLQKSPVRCQRVVWGAAVASATVNFAYEYTHSGHNLVAGGYLALLSLFGMVMFHEFLNQFEEGTGYVKRENPAFGLRWITWPTNTFCAAVAWRNHPPGPGTSATVLNAVANLERVRTLKTTAREARIETRHTRALEQKRRQNDLATADSSALSAAAPPKPADPPAMRVPTTASTVAIWVSTWAKMCADGDWAQGPLSDERSRAQYRMTARQLRNVRHAATSGALRRRAAELGVHLPPDYLDRPVESRVNGHKVR